MNLRKIEKRNARLAKTLRRYLVHLAGCVYTDCVFNHMSTEDFGNCSPIRSVKVPRSLRKKLGQTVGGHN